MSLLAAGKCCLFCDRSESQEERAHYQSGLFSSLQDATEEAKSNHFDLEIINKAELLDIIAFCHELRLLCFNCNYESPIVHESVRASVVIPYLKQMKEMEKAAEVGYDKRLKRMGVVKRGNLLIIKRWDVQRRKN